MHDARACTLGIHSNRGTAAAWCPIFAEERRRAARERYASLDWWDREQQELRRSMYARKRRGERRGQDR